MSAASLSIVARRLSFIRETDGPNAGAWVNFCQRWCSGKEGDSWCSDFVSLVIDVAYKGLPPVRRSGSCQEVLNDARAKGLIALAPAIDDLFFYIKDGRAHHVGVVTNPSPLTGIAGNTSESGTSSNGDGVYEHPLSATPPNIVFVRLPK